MMFYDIFLDGGYAKPSQGRKMLPGSTSTEAIGSPGEAHPLLRKQRMTQMKVNSLHCWWQGATSWLLIQQFARTVKKVSFISLQVLVIVRY